MEHSAAPQHMDPYMGSLDLTDTGVSSGTVYTVRERSLDPTNIAAYGSLLLVTVSVCASVAVSVCVCVCDCVLLEDGRGMPCAPAFQTSLRGRVAHVISIINSPEGRRQGEGRGALGSSNRPPCLSQRGILHGKRGGQALK